MKYMIGIDQSTQGTKVMLFDENGAPVLRVDKTHRQLIDDRGWVEHDPEEIYDNLIDLVRRLLDQSGVNGWQVEGVGISNQRETALAWERATGKPACNAIVWQCARAADICRRVEAMGLADAVQQKTGLRLSPYFTASKLAWVLENVPGAMRMAREGKLCMGTMDSYLVFRLTRGRVFAADASNASRTQLFSLQTLEWDDELCRAFGIPKDCLPRAEDSDGDYGMTDFEGLLPRAVPIRGLMGDSHAALFAHGCRQRGMMKATYGTGSSVMMNIGEKPILSAQGLATSLAWKIGGRVQYVLEGNINYSGAIMTWLKEDMHLLPDADASQQMAMAANPGDRTYLVPAFTGLGAPHWRSDVRAALVGMSRTTGCNEVVKAGLEAMAYQITDVVGMICRDAGVEHPDLRVDGGPAANAWLMQFQADMTGSLVLVPRAQELSCMGAAYAAGTALGLYGDEVFRRMIYRCYTPAMDEKLRREKYAGWRAAVDGLLSFHT